MFTVGVSAIGRVHDSCCVGGLGLWIIVGGACRCHMVCVAMTLSIVYYSLVSDISHRIILVVSRGIKVELSRDSN